MTKHMGSDLIPDIHDEIYSLIRLIPIINNKIKDGDLDIKFAIPLNVIEQAKKIGYDGDSISVRDIINLITKFFQDRRRLELADQQHHESSNNGKSFMKKYLLFNYCLAALSKDIADATMYLTNPYLTLILNSSFQVLLYCITKNEYLDDEDIRKFLAILANIIQPTSASDHYGQEYRDRFDTYCKELEKV